MAAGVPYIGNAASLSVNSVAITNVVSITAPTMSLGTAETTVLGATNHTYIPTIFEGGEFSFDVRYDQDDTSHASLITLLTAATPAAVTTVLTLQTGHTITFSAIVTAFDISGFEVETVVQATCKMKVSGACTFA